MRALIGDVVAIERANKPRWTLIREAQVSSTALRRQFSEVVTCSAPQPRVLEELEKVSANEARARQNLVLARHGKASVSLQPSTFDHWLLAEGGFDLGILAWLLEFSELVVSWEFSDRGLAAIVYGRDDASVVAPAIRAAGRMGIELRKVDRDAQLPAW